MKHTPGPWEVFEDEEGYAVGTAEDGEPVARAHPVDHVELARANAALIAAAPALYALLSNCRDAIASLDEGDLGWGEPGDGSRYPIRDEFLASIDAALAKAQGHDPAQAPSNE